MTPLSLPRCGSASRTRSASWPSTPCSARTRVIPARRWASRAPAFQLWDAHLRFDPGDPALAAARPLRALERPRVDAALRAAPPLRVRAHARRPRELPPAPLEDAGAPRVRPHARRRGHDRSARPGLRARRRHGARRARHARALRGRGRRARQPLRVRHRERRRPDGGDLRRGGLARGPLAARQPDLPLRRQPHHDRRPDVALLLRGRARCASRRSAGTCRRSTARTSRGSTPRSPRRAPRSIGPRSSSRAP